MPLLYLMLASSLMSVGAIAYVIRRNRRLGLGADPDAAPDPAE